MGWRSYAGKGAWWVAGQFALYGAGLTLPWLAGTAAPWPWGPQRMAAWAIGVLGAAVMAAGGLRLGSSLTPLPMPVEGSILKTDGLYGLVRHPIYFGVILTSLGWAAGASSSLSLLFPAAMTVFFDFKARREEAWLEEKHPEYAAYRARVKKLLPGLY